MRAFVGIINKIKLKITMKENVSKKYSLFSNKFPILYIPVKHYVALFFSSTIFRGTTSGTIKSNTKRAICKEK